MIQECIKCAPKNPRDKFWTIGKTFYLLEDNTLICHRHWYQLGQPAYIKMGEYDSVTSKQQDIADKSKTFLQRVREAHAF